MKSRALTKTPIRMKTFALTLIAAWHLPGFADLGAAAPSTLPGQNAPVQIQDTPPAAMPMPVVKPKSGTPSYPSTDMSDAMNGSMGSNPDFLDARKPKVLREENAGAGANNISAPAAPMQQRPALKPNTGGVLAPSAKLQSARSNGALQAVKISGQSGLPSPNADTTQVNAALAARFQSADLDESDRAALGIDAKQFRELASPAASVRMQTGPMAGTQRVMGAPGANNNFILSDSIKAQSVHKLNSDLFCKTYFNNQPRNSRIVPARDNQLAPDQLFVVKGACFGEQPGTLEIRFRGSPARIFKARVINWAPTMVHAQLPEDITGVTPQNVDVVLITRDNRIAPARSIAFWPKWEKIYMDRYARVTGCWSDPGYPHTRSYCKGARDTVGKKTTPFDFPGRERGGLSALNPFTSFGRTGAISANHYTEEDLAIQPVIGTDRWTFDLPPYAIYADWKAEYESFVPAKNGLQISVDPATRELLVRWHMAEMGEEGFLGYNVDNIGVWLPVGVFRP